MAVIGYIGLHVTWILSVFIGMIFFAHALRVPRSPASTAAWLLVVLLVPVVDLLLFLLFGSRKEMRVAEQLLLTVREQVPKDEADAVDLMIRNFGLPGAGPGNKLTILRTGIECWRELTDLIDSAERFIHIETFVFHMDEVGSDILKRLCEKARSGVEVRVLIDAFGNLPTRRKHFKPLKEAGGQVHLFVPFLHRRGRTNLRDHRKIAIADGKRVMAGGTNIAREYIGPTELAGRWRDLSFRLTGPAVTQYSEIFRADWTAEHGGVLDDSYVAPPGSLEKTGEQRVQVVPSGPDLSRDVLYDSLVQLVFNAKTRIRCVTPYFIPDDTLARALGLAAVRGVDVQIIVPRKSNHSMANVARGTYLRELAEFGVHVRYYDPGMVHAKLVTVDDRIAVIGSANLDLRSLFLNYEVCSFCYGGSAVKDINEWIDGLDADCSDGPEAAGRLREVGQGLARVVAPLL